MSWWVFILTGFASAGHEAAVDWKGDVLLGDQSGAEDPTEQSGGNPSRVAALRDEIKTLHAEAQEDELEKERREEKKRQLLDLLEALKQARSAEREHQKQAAEKRAAHGKKLKSTTESRAEELKMKLAAEKKRRADEKEAERARVAAAAKAEQDRLENATAGFADLEDQLVKALIKGDAEAQAAVESEAAAVVSQNPSLAAAWDLVAARARRQAATAESEQETAILLSQEAAKIAKFESEQDARVDELFNESAGVGRVAKAVHVLQKQLITEESAIVSQLQSALDAHRRIADVEQSSRAVIQTALWQDNIMIAHEVKAMEADLESYLAKRDVELERFVMEKALLSQAGQDLQERTKEARKVSEQRKSSDERALRKLAADIEDRLAQAAAARRSGDDAQATTIVEQAATVANAGLQRHNEAATTASLAESLPKQQVLDETISPELCTLAGDTYSVGAFCGKLRAHEDNATAERAEPFVVLDSEASRLATVVAAFGNRSAAADEMAEIVVERMQFALDQLDMKAARIVSREETQGRAWDNADELGQRIRSRIKDSLRVAQAAFRAAKTAKRTEEETHEAELAKVESRVKAGVARARLAEIDRKLAAGSKRIDIQYLLRDVVKRLAAAAERHRMRDEVNALVVEEKVARTIFGDDLGVLPIDWSSLDNIENTAKNATANVTANATENSTGDELTPTSYTFRSNVWWTSAPTADPTSEPTPQPTKEPTPAPSPAPTPLEHELLGLGSTPDDCPNGFRVTEEDCAGAGVAAATARGHVQQNELLPMVISPNAPRGCTMSVVGWRPFWGNLSLNPQLNRTYQPVCKIGSAPALCSTLSLVEGVECVVPVVSAGYSTPYHMDREYAMKDHIFGNVDVSDGSWALIQHVRRGAVNITINSTTLDAIACCSSQDSPGPSAPLVRWARIGRFAASVGGAFASNDAMSCWQAEVEVGSQSFECANSSWIMGPFLRLANGSFGADADPFQLQPTDTSGTSPGAAEFRFDKLDDSDVAGQTLEFRSDGYGVAAGQLRVPAGLVFAQASRSSDITLRVGGWRFTRGYARGFVQNLPGAHASAVVSGLEPGGRYEVRVYQHADDATQAGWNDLYVNHGFARTYTKAGDNSNPTYDAEVTTTAAGTISLMFSKDAPHLHLSGISVTPVAPWAYGKRYRYFLLGAGGGICSSRGVPAFPPAGKSWHIATDYNLAEQRSEIAEALCDADASCQAIHYQCRACAPLTDRAGPRNDCDSSCPGGRYFFLVPKSFGPLDSDSSAFDYMCQKRTGLRLEETRRKKAVRRYVRTSGVCIGAFGGQRHCRGSADPSRCERACTNDPACRAYEVPRSGLGRCCFYTGGVAGDGTTKKLCMVRTLHHEGMALFPAPADSVTSVAEAIDRCTDAAPDAMPVGRQVHVAQASDCGGRIKVFASPIGNCSALDCIFGEQHLLVDNALPKPVPQPCDPWISIGELACTASPWGAPFRDQKYGQCAGFPRCAPASTEIDSAEKCKAKCLSTRVQESAGQDYVNASLVHACDAITFRKWSNGTAVCTLFSGCVAGKPTKKEQPYVFYDSAGRGVVNNETLISYMLSDCPGVEPVPDANVTYTEIAYRNGTRLEGACVDQSYIDAQGPNDIPAQLSANGTNITATGCRQACSRQAACTAYSWRPSAADPLNRGRIECVLTFTDRRSCSAASIPYFRRSPECAAPAQGEARRNFSGKLRPLASAGPRRAANRSLSSGAAPIPDFTCIVKDELATTPPTCSSSFVVLKNAMVIGRAFADMVGLTLTECCEKCDMTVDDGGRACLSFTYEVAAGRDAPGRCSLHVAELSTLGLRTELGAAVSGIRYGLAPGLVVTRDGAIVTEETAYGDTFQISPVAALAEQAVQPPRELPPVGTTFNYTCESGAEVRLTFVLPDAAAEHGALAANLGFASATADSARRECGCRAAALPQGAPQEFLAIVDGLGPLRPARDEDGRCSALAALAPRAPSSVCTSTATSPPDANCSQVTSADDCAEAPPAWQCVWRAASQHSGYILEVVSPKPAPATFDYTCPDGTEIRVTSVSGHAEATSDTSAVLALASQGGACSESDRYWPRCEAQTDAFRRKCACHAASARLPFFAVADGMVQWPDQDPGKCTSGGNLLPLNSTNASGGDFATGYSVQVLPAQQQILSPPGLQPVRWTQFGNTGLMGTPDDRTGAITAEPSTSWNSYALSTAAYIEGAKSRYTGVEFVVSMSGKVMFGLAANPFNASHCGISAPVLPVLAADAEVPPSELLANFSAEITDWCRAKLAKPCSGFIGNEKADCEADSEKRVRRECEFSVAPAAGTANAHRSWWRGPVVHPTAGCASMMNQGEGNFFMVASWGAQGALGRWSYRDRDLPLAGVNDRADATDKDVWTFRLGAAGRVEYLRNGELYYTSPVAPEFPLVPMVIFEGGSVLRAYMLEKDRGCTAEAEPFVSRAAFRRRSKGAVAFRAQTAGKFLVCAVPQTQPPTPAPAPELPREPVPFEPRILPGSDRSFKCSIYDTTVELPDYVPLGPLARRICDRLGAEVVRAEIEDREAARALEAAPITEYGKVLRAIRERLEGVLIAASSAIKVSHARQAQMARGRKESEAAEAVVLQGILEAEQAIEDERLEEEIAEKEWRAELAEIEEERNRRERADRRIRQSEGEDELALRERLLLQSAAGFALLSAERRDRFEKAAKARRVRIAHLRYFLKYMQDALEGETTAQQAFGKKVDRAVAQRDAQITAVESDLSDLRDEEIAAERHAAERQNRLQELRQEQQRIGNNGRGAWVEQTLRRAEDDGA